MHVHVGTFRKTPTDSQQLEELLVRNLHACMGLALKTDLSQRVNRSFHALQALCRPATIDHPDAIAQHTLFKKRPNKMVRQQQFNNRLVAAKLATKFGMLLERSGEV